MGRHGPIPKRSSERRRRNAPAGGEVVKLRASGGVAWPDALEGWHPTAARWYESLARSRQRGLYQPSDVATAVYVAEMMSRSLRAPRMSSVMVLAVVKAMAELMTTEASRRRVRGELEAAS